MASYRVVVVPVLSDNFAYLLVDTATSSLAAVDPAEPEKLIEAAAREGLTINMILTTHKHWDHAGGNLKMAELLPGVTVVGGAKEGCDGCTHMVQHGDIVKLGDTSIQCLDTPFHTGGHVSFVVGAGGADAAVFTGDSLFVGGCGRFFEGNPTQACRSLLDVLGGLPPATKVYCGHEYTVKNLEFALTMEPDNVAVQDKLRWAQQQISQGLHTVPTTIQEEKLHNPFMRVAEASLQKACGTANMVDTMGEVRRRKDAF